MTTRPVNHIEVYKLAGLVTFRVEIPVKKYRATVRGHIGPVVMHYLFKYAVTLPFPISFKDNILSHLKQAVKTYKKCTLRPDTTSPRLAQSSRTSTHMLSATIPRVHFVRDTCDIPRHTAILEATEDDGEHCIYCIRPVMEVPENEQEQFCLQCNKAKVRKGVPNGGGPAEQDCQDQDEHSSRATVTASEDDYDAQEPCVPKVVSYSSSVADLDFGSDEQHPTADLDFSSNEQSPEPIPENNAMCGTGSENELIDIPDDPSTHSPKDVSETTGNTSRPIKEPDSPPTAEVPTASHPATTQVSPADVHNEFNAMIEKCIRGPIEKIEERARARKVEARIIDNDLESAIRHETAAEAAVAELERQLKVARAKKVTMTEKVVYHHERRKSHDLKKPDVQAEKKLILDRYPTFSTLMKDSRSLGSEDRAQFVNKRRKTDGSRDSPLIVE